jgi:hypothetical protein
MPLLFKKILFEAIGLRKILTLVLVIPFIAACSKTVDLALPFNGPQIAVVAHIDPTGGIRAFVTKTAAPTGEFLIEELQISNATVTVFDEEGNASLVPPLRPGFYELPSFNAVTAQRYRLEISAAGLDTLRSEWVVIPERVVAPDLEVIITLDEPIIGFPNHEANLFFSGIDPVGDTYYFTRVFLDREGGIDPGFEFFADFDTRFCEAQQYNYFFFPDNCMQEDTFSFQYNPNINVINDQGTERVSMEEVVFALRSIDENYYNYQRDKLRLDGETGAILEARPATTNVTGGVGVFLASNSFLEVVEVP